VAESPGEHESITTAFTLMWSCKTDICPKMERPTRETYLGERKWVTPDPRLAGAFECAEQTVRAVVRGYFGSMAQLVIHERCIIGFPIACWSDCACEGSCKWHVWTRRGDTLYIWSTITKH